MPISVLHYHLFTLAALFLCIHFYARSSLLKNLWSGIVECAVSNPIKNLKPPKVPVKIY